MIFLNSFDINKLFSPRVREKLSVLVYCLKSLNDFPIEGSEKVTSGSSVVVAAVITNIYCAISDYIEYSNKCISMSSQYLCVVRLTNFIYALYVESLRFRETI